MLVVNSFSNKGFYYRNNSVKNHNTTFTSAKVGQRFIKNSLYGELSQDLQAVVKKIYSDLQDVKEYIRLNSTNPPKINKAKKTYAENNPDFVLVENARRITFRDTDELISVVNNKSDSKNVRLVVEKDAKETHLLIDNNGRIVSNLNKKYPFMMPQTLRYMTSQEIRHSQAEKYIRFISEKLADYKEFLTNPVKPVQKEIKSSKLANVVKEVKEVSKAKNPKENIENVINIFDKKVEELPLGVKLSISPNSGKVLGFTFNSSDGYTYNVAKYTISKYQDTLRYISVKEVFNNTAKNVCIDLDTKEMIQVDLLGKPKIINDAVYELEDDKKNLADDILSRMLEKMLSAQKDDNLSKEIIVLKNKVNKVIKDIAIEDIEDVEVTKLVEKEAKLEGQFQQEIFEKPVKKEVVNKDVKVEEVPQEKVVKKRGRKPKTQETSQQVKQTEIINSSEQLKLALVEFKEAMSREFDILIEKIGKIVNNK